MWLISGLLKRRSAAPAWNSLTHEEQGIVVRNRQRNTYAVRDLADAYSTPNFSPATRRY